MKKLLTVSFVALISAISAGNAAIPDKTYVDDTVDTAITDLTGTIELVHMITNQAITGDSEKILNLGSGDMGMNVVPNLESPNKESIVGGINSVYDVVKTNKSNIETLENADATNLQAAKDYANSLASNYDAAGSAATAQTNAVEYTDGKIAELAATYETKTNVSLAVQEAKDYADDKASEAGTDAKSYADEELLKKVDKTGHTASQVVITDSTGTITTAAQIPNTQVSGLGGLATKSTIANADVAADAAIAQSKIAGLEDALAAKVDDSQVVATGGTVTSSDAQVPTIARMEAAISNATGNIDMSSKVDVAQSVKGGVLTTNADTGNVEVSATIAQDKVDGLASGLAAKVDVAQSAKNAFMVADVTGNVVPVPAGDCANTANKCALVTGVDDQGNLVLSWEVIARNVTTATE